MKERSRMGIIPWNPIKLDSWNRKQQITQKTGISTQPHIFFQQVFKSVLGMDTFLFLIVTQSS